MQHNRIVLGLLGGIGAGKSFVAGRVAALAPGAVVDADALAREALDACAADGRLTEALGPGLVDSDGKPDRRAVAERAFHDAPTLRTLERLTHPVVLAMIKSAVQDHREGQGPDVLVLDAPLLIEVGLDRECDALWLVEADEALRLERAAARGLSPEDVRRRERNQSPLERKRARADLIIHNQRDAEDLDRQILEGLRALGVQVAAHS